MKGVRLLALGLCALTITGCASSTYAYHDPDEFARTFEQPFRDVGWMRESPPELLQRAAAAPYALAPNWDCQTLMSELAALNLVLGPDLDTPDASGAPPAIDAARLMSSAVGGVWGLPYRGIVRWLSGADERERVLRNAILAGTVRRAFLRGVIQTANCEPAPVEAALAPETPP